MKRNQWLWFAVVMAAVGLLIVAALKSDYFTGDAGAPAEGLGKKPVQVPPEPTRQESGGAGTRAAETGMTSRRVLSETTPQIAPVATGASEHSPMGPSQHRKISDEIYEWARTKSAEELIRHIDDELTLPLMDRAKEFAEKALALQALWREKEISLEQLDMEFDKLMQEYPDLADENEDSVNPMLENETAQKASYALAVKLDEDPSLYALFRATLMGGTVSAHTATRLVEILGLMRDRNATDLLLELIALPSPPAPIENLIRAFRSECWLPTNATSLDGCIRQLDDWPPEQRCGFPDGRGVEPKLPEPRIIETFLSLLDNRMASWTTESDRMQLFIAFEDILGAYKKLGRASARSAEGDSTQVGDGTDRYFEEIFRRMEWLARNATDPATKGNAMDALIVVPQGERSYAPLLDALRDSNDRVRLTAISNLAGFKKLPVVEAALIDAAKNDPDWGNRRVAIQFLPSTGAGGQVKLTLARAWYRPNNHHMARMEAIGLLRGCGIEAIPDLERIAQEDSDNEIRQYAQVAIRDIEFLRDCEERRRETLKVMGLEEQSEGE